MAKEDILSKQEKQKIKDDYNALYEEGIMEVLKYGGKRELSKIGDLYFPLSKEEKNKAQAKRSLELSKVEKKT